MLARLFVFIGGLIVLALTAALVGPYFVDWTSYRADFEREASRILGRAVTVEGTATARLLPFPSVRFTDVRVAGATPGEPQMTVASFSMDAELSPFLRGEILIFDMRLERPSATITVAEGGTVDWAVRPGGLFDPSQISLEKITVAEGTVRVRHALSGREHIVSEINAEIAARTLAGPWRLDGSMRLDGQAASVNLSTGTVEGDGTLRLRVRVRPAGYAFALETDGRARMNGGAASYEGRFKLDAGKRAVEDEAAQQAEAPAGYRFAGAFSVDNNRLDVSQFRLETGTLDDPYTADGTALLDFGVTPRFLIQATGAQVRLDGGESEDGDITGLALQDRLDALNEAVLDLPRPGIAGTVDIDLPAIVAGDTTIRDVSFSAEPGEGGWTVNTLRATLPGRTRLEANGLISAGRAMRFDGRLLLAVGQPSGFAAWLARDVDEAIRRLPAAGFAADVELGAERQLFNNLELILGTARFRGSLDRQVRDAVRPAMIAALEGEALDVDGMAAFASLFVSDAGVTHFGGHDIDFSLKAGPVRLSGLAADTVDTAFRLRGNQLDIDRLAVTGFAGANISATAKLREIDGRPSGSVDASILAGDLAPFARLVAARFPQNALAAALAGRADAYQGLMDDAQIDLVASLERAGAGPGQASLGAQGHIGDSDISLSLSSEAFDGDLFGAPLALSLEAETTNTAELLAFAGLPAFDLGLTGEGSAQLAVDGTLAQGAAVRFALLSPQAQARFSGNATVTGTTLSAKGGLGLSGDDLEPWLMTSGMTLPGMGLGLPADLKGTVALDGGVLTLADFVGNIAGNTVSGTLEARVKDGLPDLGGTLALGGFDLALVAGVMLGEGAIEYDGEGWPDAPFVQVATLPFTGRLDLKVDTLGVGDWLSAESATFNLALDRDGLRLTDLKAGFVGGSLEGLADLKNNQGTGLFSGQLAIKGADTAALLRAPGFGGTADLSATATASGRTVGGLIAALTGSGTARLVDLSVPGLSAIALEPILARADEIGRDITAEQTAGFAPALVADGALGIGDFVAPFTIAGGVIRTPPLFLEAGAARLETEARADLNSGVVSMDGQLRYEAGDEAVVGSEPVVGFAVNGPIGNAVRSFDTEPLAQFLTQRALEREQARVEKMQAELLEKQRLRREVRYYTQLTEVRRVRQAAEEARLKAEEEAKRQAEEAARLKAEEEAKRQAEEAARLKAEEEAKRHAEEAARLKAEEDAKRQAEEAARLKAEEEAKRQAAEAARLKAEEEAKRQAAEEARLKAEEEAKRQAEEAARLKAEEEAKRQAEEAARLKAEEDAKRQAEEAARLKAEEEAKRQAEEAARLKAEEDAKRQAAEEARLKAEEEAKRQGEEAARLKAEEEAKRQAEEDAARIRADDEARRRAEEKARLRAEEAARKRARDAVRETGRAASADTIIREALPPPARPQRARPGSATELDFDAMDIEEFLKSHSSER
ncbi:AsmA family protein [Nitratireductor sp. CAU 1489]|uniref:AsmA family protein n=1 Tax=Nitratireductor arenosus TaxID=2682096 RepID=A0A844QDV2_9HYPH|nr:AsmA family protein [Nitratireductor arenosus]MVA97177.1 AsmA family protein [Nitratireductor arenosus]